jgi:hypothetical protein
MAFSYLCEFSSLRSFELTGNRHYGLGTANNPLKTTDYCFLKIAYLFLSLTMFFII